MSTWHDDEHFWATFGPALEHASPERATHDIEGFLDLARLPPGGRVLDVGCGPGRHSMALARAGATVTALDRSARQLRHLDQVASSEGHQIERVRRDMRDFTRPGHFHGILWSGDAVGLFDDEADDLTVVQNLFASLRRGGRLVVAPHSKELYVRSHSPQRWALLSGESAVLEERTVRDGWNRCAARLTVLDGGRRESAEASWRLYAGSELVALLRAAGFERVRLFGDFERIPYDLDARRLVAVAER